MKVEIDDIFVDVLNNQAEMIRDFISDESDSEMLALYYIELASIEKVLKQVNIELKLVEGSSKLMEEIWKDIPGYEGFYEASNLGNIRRFINKRLLKNQEDRSGYYRVTLHKKGINKGRLMQRWIAETWILNPLNKPYVNHKDGNKKNNIVDNLEWVTASENSRHAFATGLAKPIYKESFYVFNYKTEEFLGEFKFEREAEEKLNIASRRNINSCLIGKRDYTDKYIFIYKSQYTEEFFNQKLKKAKENKHNNQKRGIIVYWVDEILNYFHTLKECSESLGLTQSYICNILNNKKINNSEYHFEWYDEENIKLLL